MNLENNDLSCADSLENQEPEIKTESSELQKVSDNVEKIKYEHNFSSENEISNTDFGENALYEEVLDKLDIKRKSKDDEVSLQGAIQKQVVEPQNQNPQNKLLRAGVEKAIKNDFVKIQKMVNAGFINSAQGQNLQRQVLKKAFDSLVQAEKNKRNEVQPPPQIALQNTQVVNALQEFKNNNPTFFNQNGRKEVYEFLNNGKVSLGKDELNKISEIIRVVEKSAIDRYLQKVSYEKTLKSSNDEAKKRLTANAQKSAGTGNVSKTFTREQIGKMTSAEFIKYEPIIMQQLKKGLIK